jgi:WD40 repeat protein
MVRCPVPQPTSDISAQTHNLRSQDFLTVFVFFFAAIALFAVNPSFGETPSGPTYWKDIRPILRKNCTVCHSARNLKEVDVSGGLALDTYEAVLKGGKSRVIQAGNSTASQLVKLIMSTDSEKRMPLAATPLPPESISLIRRWIDSGAKEGASPGAEAVHVSTPVPRSVRKKLDVILPTDAIAPKVLVKGSKPGRLELDLKVGPLAPVAAVAFSPDGRLLAAGSYGSVTIWDLAKAQPATVLTNVLGSVNDVRFSPDGRLLAVAGGQPSARGDLRLYRVVDWQLLASLGGQADVVFSVAFHPGGKQLASASFDKTVRIWDLPGALSSPDSHEGAQGDAFPRQTKGATGPVLRKVLTHHSDFVYDIVFSPDGKWLASCSKDRSVRLVDPATGKSLFTLGGMTQDVLAVAISPDGRWVTSSGFDARLTWWDSRTGRRVRQQSGHSVAVHEICFSKDGKLVASAGGDKTVRIWDGSTGSPLQTLKVGSLCYAVALRPDSKLVASGSFDGLVRLWDTASGRQLATLLSVPSDSGRGDWLALTPQGYVASSPGLDTAVRWFSGGETISSAAILQALGKPLLVAKAVNGEPLPAPAWDKKASSSVDGSKLQ